MPTARLATLSSITSASRHRAHHTRHFHLSLSFTPFSGMARQELLEDFRFKFRLDGIPDDMYNTDLTSTDECTIWCQMGGQVARPRRPRLRPHTQSSTAPPLAAWVGGELFSRSRLAALHCADTSLRPPPAVTSHSALHCRFPLCPPLTLPTPAASRLFWRSWGRYPPRNRRRQREGCGSVCRPSAACAVSSTNTKVISPTCQSLSAACTAKSKPRVHCIARSAARCRACLAGVLVARL